MIYIHNEIIRMLSTKLYTEFQNILKHDYEMSVNDSGSKTLANDIVSIFEILIDMKNDNEQNGHLCKD